jgi:excisionase family DNA binding protein
MKLDTNMSRSDIEAAQELSRLFAQHKGQNTEIQIGTEKVLLPSGVGELMLEVLTQLSKGKHVSIVPSNSDLTTAEVADLLNVSRPYVVRLLEEGKLPFHMVGTHRRVAFKDALEYKSNQRQKSLEAMQALMAESQELGLGY